MTVTHIENLAELQTRVESEVALSDWFEVTQERINLFAEATEDRNWLHIDPARAARESPFKETIAHGFLTLSLLSELLKLAMSVGGVRMGINYGLNRVRFVRPVPAGRFVLAGVEPIAGGVQAMWKVTIERDGSEKPCCVAEWLVRYYV